MAARTTIFLFSLFVVLCLSQTPLDIYKEGDIKYEVAFNFSIPASNLETIATFSINHTAHVVVCFQERFPITNGSQFSNDTCTFFFNFSHSTQDTVDVPLRNLDYNVGVYFASEAITPENTTRVSVSVTGKTCLDDMYYDSLRETCVLGTKVDAANGTIVVDVGSASQTQFFVIEAPQLLGSVAASLGAEAADQPVFLRLRFAGAPSATVYDADDSRGPAKFNSPRPGVWVLGVEAHVEGKYEVHLKVEACSTRPGFAGPGCETPYAEAADNMTLVALPNEYHYWSFLATAKFNLNVSLTTLDHKDLPYLLLSRGNIPTLGNADIINCNQGYCSIVRSVHVNVSGTQDELWFIGVTASVTEGNTTFGIWFNETCAPDCETDNHGTCQIDGTCYCQIDFTGIDCTTSKGLGAQYIVLIIIASLVVASAIIGFVAWAYMRRKRVNYELVS